MFMEGSRLIAAIPLLTFVKLYDFDENSLYHIKYLIYMEFSGLICVLQISTSTKTLVLWKNFLVSYCFPLIVYYLSNLIIRSFTVTNLWYFSLFLWKAIPVHFYKIKIGSFLSFCKMPFGHSGTSS